MNQGRVVRVLGISGSLRAASSNRALVRAAARLVPAGAEMSIYSELGEIPPFNPDLDTDAGPAAVAKLRATLQSSDAVLISSPEYAHGVSGVLKNALDWLVGSGELIDTPVAVINTSPRATHAHASLCETLSTMSARVIEEASVPIPLTAAALDAEGHVTDPQLSASLRSAIAALVLAVLPGPLRGSRPTA